MSGWREKLERLFAAVAFAEAGSPETAREIMGASPERQETDDFLATIGLKGVRVWYGVAEIAESVDFAAAVGLKGVRVVYGMAHVTG